jgi:site-specific recombinase XerD
VTRALSRDVNPGLQGRVDAYLELRRALGYQLRAHTAVLGDYVAFAATAGQGSVSLQSTAAWVASTPGLSAEVISRRVSMLRQFAEYLRAFDPACQPPPAGLFGQSPQRRAPHVFTSAQIDALLDATATIGSPLWAAGARTLIGLLAATGLRPGEAWRLDDTDLDAAAGLLLIRCSKWGRTRQIPVHPTTITALGDYQARRDRLRPPGTDCPALILDHTGARLHTVGPSATFHRLLAHTGISAPAGQRAPRMHDLRHTFAVATLRDWHRAGLAVQPRLAALSAYLGQVNPAHTYWYFQAVPDLMTVIGQRSTEPDPRTPQVTS